MAQRQLNANERRLLALFGIAIFVVANLAGFSYVRKLNASTAMQLVELKNKQIEGRGWLKEKDLWHQRKVWLDERQPKAPADGTANSALLQSIQESAKAKNITILDQSLPEPENTATYKEVSVRLKVNAKLADLTSWLAEIQSPELFQAIKQFNIRSDKEPPNVICDLQISRWYAP